MKTISKVSKQKVHHIDRAEKMVEEYIDFSTERLGKRLCEEWSKQDRTFKIPLNV